MRKNNVWIAIWLSTKIIIKRLSRYVFIILKIRFNSISFLSILCNLKTNRDKLHLQIRFLTNVDNRRVRSFSLCSCHICRVHTNRQWMKSTRCFTSNKQRILIIVLFNYIAYIEHIIQFFSFFLFFHFIFSSQCFFQVNIYIKWRWNHF